MILYLNPICFREIPNHAAGVACSQTMGRNIPRYDAAGTDHTAFPDRHAAANHHIGCQPAVVLDGDRFCIFQIVETPVFPLAHIALLR